MVNIVDRRRSSLSRAERPPLSAKLITRFGNGPIVAKFLKSIVRGKVPEVSTLIFEIPEFLYNTE